MTQDQFIEELCFALTETKINVKIQHQYTSNTIKDALMRGDTVDVPGLGTFAVVDRAECTMQHPRTGEPLAVPAKRVIEFRPAKALRVAIPQPPPDHRAARAEGGRDD